MECLTTWGRGDVLDKIYRIMSVALDVFGVQTVSDALFATPAVHNGLVERCFDAWQLAVRAALVMEAKTKTIVRSAIHCALLSELFSRRSETSTSRRALALRVTF